MTHADAKNFQPANITFDLLPALEKKIRDRKERHRLQCQLALKHFEEWLERLQRQRRGVESQTCRRANALVVRCTQQRKSRSAVPARKMRRRLPQYCVGPSSEFRALYTDGGFSATALGSDQILDRMLEGPVWVALRGGAVLGTVAAVVKGDSIYIRGMAVLPNAEDRELAPDFYNSLKFGPAARAAPGCS